MRLKLAVGTCLLVLVLHPAAFAQTPSHPQSETYGTSSETAIAIADWELNPVDSTTTYASNDGRYVTSVSGTLGAGIHFPEGASITRMELQACDSNAIKSAAVSLSFRPNNSGISFGLATINTGATPGCALFSVTLSPAATVDNVGKSYFVEAGTGGGGDGTVTIQAIRVFYKLQVSPPPGTATFADVPTTHLFFQYVEALAAAGITSGCGGGNFCPDAAVTRGQMAVFLAKALGLHWAP